MFQMHLFPTAEELEGFERDTPAYMRPNNLPYAIVGEGYLSDEQCDNIVAVTNEYEPYSFHSCGALTRECPRPLHRVLDPIVEFTRNCNDFTWQYDLDDDAAAWMQTYEEGGRYQMHTDTAPGQTRKLTAVAMLSDKRAYAGGDLRIYAHPVQYVVPRTRGTVVVFLSHFMHDVTEVKWGLRQTINLGIYGPAFR